MRKINGQFYEFTSKLNDPKNRYERVIKMLFIQTETYIGNAFEIISVRGLSQKSLFYYTAWHSLQ